MVKLNITLKDAEFNLIEKALKTYLLKSSKKQKDIIADILGIMQYQKTNDNKFAQILR